MNPITDRMGYTDTGGYEDPFAKKKKKLEYQAQREQKKESEKRKQEGSSASSVVSDAFSSLPPVGWNLEQQTGNRVSEEKPLAQYSGYTKSSIMPWNTSKPTDINIAVLETMKSKDHYEKIKELPAGTIIDMQRINTPQGAKAA